MQMLRDEKMGEHFELVWLEYVKSSFEYNSSDPFSKQGEIKFVAKKFIEFNDKFFKKSEHRF